jgi:pimeloyl-ACP methyl ester carboxylesterase
VASEKIHRATSADDTEIAANGGAITINDDRIHRAVSADGTEIAGRVEGRGTPLVLVHSTVHDGAGVWEALLPHLADRFTCYLPSLRGRGSSGDSPDHSPPRFQEDVDAFVDSIGEPVFLMGWSDGANLALGAAANSGAVAAVVAYEPTAYALMGDDDVARFGTVIEQQVEAVADGRALDAALIFLRFVCTDDELATLDPAYIDRQASIHPLVMEETQKEASYVGPHPTDPGVLTRIEAPVLVLVGQQTRLDTFITDSAQHVEQHVADARVRELPDVGHYAPIVAPEPVAKELLSFFESIRHTA